MAAPTRAWMYYTSPQAPPSTGTEQHVLQLIAKGALAPDALVWTSTEENWVPAATIEPFRETAAAAASPWRYMSANGKEQLGPASAGELVPLFENGAIDGMTLVWTAGMEEWKPISEAPGLRELLQIATQEEDDNDGDLQENHPLVTASTAATTAAAAAAAAAATTNSSVSLPSSSSTIITPTSAEVLPFDPSAMVFEPDLEKQPPIPADMPRLAAAAAAAAAAGSSGGERRGYISDDGTSYVWDEATGGWIEGAFLEEDEESSDDEKQQRRLEGENGSQEARPANRKRQREQTAAKTAPAEAENADETAEETVNATVTSSETSKDGGKAGETEAGGDKAAQRTKKKAKKAKKGFKTSEKLSARWIYVQGLPADATPDEVIAHFAKCGVLAIDPLTQNPKVKMYRDQLGGLKGDASICYAKDESVDLALEVLDGGQLRPGVFIQVSKAKFEQKGEKFDPTKRLRLNDARVRVAREAQEQALSWNDESDSGAASRRKGGLRIVVLENLFAPQEFTEGGEAFAEQLEKDIMEICGDVGPVERLAIHRKNRLGPAVVKFSTAFASEEAVRTLDGFEFRGRKIRCHYWDGVTDYAVNKEVHGQNHDEDEKRLDEFGNWLEEQDLPEELQLKTEG